MRWQVENRDVRVVDVDYLVRPPRLKQCTCNDTLPIDWHAKRNRLRYLEMLNMRQKQEKTRFQRFMDFAYNATSVVIPVVAVISAIVIVVCAAVQVVSNW